MKNSIIKLSIIIISITVLITYSCKKKKDECVAGTGGAITIVAKLQHHGNYIGNLPASPDTVFVKFNTLNSPGSSPSNFDTYFVGEAGEDHVHMPNLKCGNYYFYAVGSDTLFTPGDTTPVRGGVPFSTENTTGEINVTIPVSE